MPAKKGMLVEAVAVTCGDCEGDSDIDTETVMGEDSGGGGGGLADAMDGGMLVGRGAEVDDRTGRGKGGVVAGPALLNSDAEAATLVPRARRTMAPLDSARETASEKAGGASSVVGDDADWNDVKK